MSHLLGALSDSAPAITLDQTRQWAIRAALDACANGQYTSAAAELEASRDAAVALAAMLADFDPAAEAHMLHSADQAETWAAEAWNAARADLAPVVTLRPRTPARATAA